MIRWPFISHQSPIKIQIYSSIGVCILHRRNKNKTAKSDQIFLKSDPNETIAYTRNANGPALLLMPSNVHTIQWTMFNIQYIISCSKFISTSLRHLVNQFTRITMMRHCPLECHSLLLHIINNSNKGYKNQHDTPSTQI